jgi:hypothetical protein
MIFLQSTLEEIIDSEREMMLSAKVRYGKYYSNALACSLLLSKCVGSFDHSREMFARFLTLMKNHHLLALFSIVRLHKVQAMMNLRQVLEAGASAAFAIANPEKHHFAETTDLGTLDPTQELTRKRYQWLESNYKDKSDAIKMAKERINRLAAHANIVATHSIYRVEADGEIASVPFFDVEDEYLVNADLWQAASISLELMDLLYGVNQKHDVIEFIPGFANDIGSLAQATNALVAELRATDRYKKTASKLGLPDA